jgi:hypothetical protein
MTSKKVKVVKIPLPNEIKNRNYPKAFPKMPILYLELIENKSKIKPEFINTDYVPKVVSGSISEEPPKIENYELSETENEKTDNEKSDIEKTDNETEVSDNEDKSSEEEDEKSSEDDEKSEDEDDESVSSSSSKSRKKPSNNKKISNRLKQLLGDSDEEKEDYKPPSSSNQPQQSFNAPSLKDLERTGKFVQKKEVEDIGHVTISEQEQEDAKRELLFKFELLKKSYKTDNIPEFTIHSDLETMRKSYESTLRTLSLDKSVDDYKKYLIGGFMLMEFVCGNWLGFDMQGFTQQQIVSMNSYERLLIELGEKSYVPSGSKWPVEVRLLFLVVMNAAFFIISKMILKKTGSNLMGMINNMNSEKTSFLKKRKMKGPSVNIDDIPDIDENNNDNGNE